MEHKVVDEIAAKLAAAVTPGDDVEDLQNKFYGILWENTRGYEKPYTAEDMYKDCRYNYAEFSRRTGNTRGTLRKAVAAGDKARIIFFDGQPTLLIEGFRGRKNGNTNIK
ncbi:hypothetical protein [Vibrio phage vB_VpM-pA2SJ1]|uniref:Uncharacterized protein n=1 Tax=Vibrio phage vB_VpM-pA2SJ1 TaxID=3095964 RepID=A0AAX4J6B2_9CAUD